MTVEGLGRTSIRSITEPPSSYVPGRVFGCFFDDMVGVDAAPPDRDRAARLRDRLPHQDSTWPHTDASSREIGERVPPDELEMLVRTNAIEMLDLDPGDLRPDRVALHSGTRTRTSGGAIMSYDLVIRNGTVVDGSGLGALPRRRRHRRRPHRDDRPHPRARRPPRSTPRATSSRPASSTATPTWTPRSSGTRLGANSCWHGVTTVGDGQLRLHPRALRREATRRSSCATSSAPRTSRGKAMAAGIEWTWTTFAEYLDAVDRLPKGINYAANIGHSALRTYVMGERAFEETATDDDLRSDEGRAARGAARRRDRLHHLAHPPPPHLRRPPGRLAARGLERGRRARARDGRDRGSGSSSSSRIRRRRTAPRPGATS